MIRVSLRFLFCNIFIFLLLKTTSIVDLATSACLSGRLPAKISTQISAFIKGRDTKLVMKSYVNCKQIKLILICFISN